jgi:nicotinamidase-related amidase
MTLFQRHRTYPMKTALLVIDAQTSFVHRPYWHAGLAADYLTHQNALIDACTAQAVPIVRIFHTDGDNVASNPFAPASGHITPLSGLRDFQAAATFEKHRHSALVGTGLAAWLQAQGITKLIVSGIRTEQCCETTTRHASDEGWDVDYVTDATLTFDMNSPQGALVTAAQLKERTATVLQGRFAQVCSVPEAVARIV